MEENLANECVEDDALTKSQKARIERNRQKALLLRQAKATKRTLADVEREAAEQIQNKAADTGGGFLLEEEDEALSQLNVVHRPGVLLGCDALICEECDKEFMESYLNDKFSKVVCDTCKDIDGKHRLITKTDAKERYLLKDADLDKRDPLLKFILKKNPHNMKWGEMKLFLESQVAERALEIWGSDEKLEEERERRSANKDKLKKKKFDKKVNELRMAVRGSLYKKTTDGHQHVYDAEIYNEADDTYTKICKSCGHCVTFEKM